MTSKPDPLSIESTPKTAIILAGGLGTRLRTTIMDQPKVLALAAGRPFLSHLLTYLSRQGISMIILSIGYKGAQVRDFVGDGSRWSVRVIYCQEQRPLGTGGALRLASESLSSTPFFAFNGDTLFNVDLKRLWQAHCNRQNMATLALRRVDSSEWAQRGCVILAKDGRILSFDEKPDSIEALHPKKTMLVNGGVYILEKNALASVAPGEKASLEREIFPELVHKGMIAGMVEEGYFADIGTPESLAAFERDINLGIVPHVKAEK